jgi:hypothetical protein
LLFYPDALPGKAYACPAPVKEVHTIGVEFAFQGTGTVKNISTNPVVCGTSFQSVD